jgi:hypothetical protein
MGNPMNGYLLDAMANLWWACLTGDLAAVVAHLKAGTPVEYHPHSMVRLVTPLMAACHHGHAHVVDVLLFHTQRLEARTTEGMTALSLACAAGHTECAMRLCSAGADL